MERVRKRGAKPCAQIDFGKLREFHLERDWSNQSAAEEEIAFENLVFIVRNYLQRGYEHIIVEDLKDFRVQQMAEVFADAKPRIVTLVLRDGAELRRRIAQRNEGWTNADGAVEINREILERGEMVGERKIDVSGKTPGQVAQEAMRVLEKRLGQIPRSSR